MEAETFLHLVGQKLKKRRKTLPKEKFAEEQFGGETFLHLAGQKLRRRKKLCQRKVC